MPNLDEFRCDECGQCHELCFCDYDCLPGEEQMPVPGTDGWDEMIDFMRADLESDMTYSKIIAAGRKIVEGRGEDFEEKFEE